MKQINLSSHILKHFRKVLDYILKNKFFRIVIKGGRSSGKSFFIAMALIIYVCVRDRSVIAILSTKIDVQKRLDNVFLRALEVLGLSDNFRYVSTKHEFIKLNADGTDSKVSIVCTGADDPERLKGVTPKKGSWGVLWIEEATNFNNIKQIKNIESTIGRGDIYNFTSIISYNPRQSTSHHLNVEFNNVKEGDELVSYEIDEETLTSSRVTLTEVNDELRLEQLVFHCTYKELIKQGHIDFISPTDLVDIKYGEEHDTEYWHWYYLGEACGSDTLNVFRNVTAWNFDDKLLANKIDRAVDFSNGGSDDYHYGAWYYDSQHNDLYCMDELRLPGSAGMKELAVGIKNQMQGNYFIWTDSAVPEFTNQLNNAGIRAAGAKKGKDSRYAGIMWLRSLNHIYIDDKVAPHTWREFTTYEYKVDKKTEEVLPEIPDGNDHSIDACRYAECVNIRDTRYYRGKEMTDR
jgi:PBSX family phage terminase large subunit